MPSLSNRREFLRRLGITGAALPFLWNLPSLGWANQTVRKQRLVVIFSPNGTQIATIDRNGEARLWDAASGQTLFSLDAFKYSSIQNSNDIGIALVVHDNIFGMIEIGSASQIGRIQQGRSIRRQFCDK